MMKTIAFLGLGAMGERMAAHLLGDDYRLVVYNRTKAKAEALLKAGAHWASIPKAAALEADVVLSMVSNDEVSRLVWFDPEQGALAGLRKGALAIESSTLTPGWVRELAEAVVSQGGRFLDAPVVGTRPQAEAAQLVYLVGGEAAEMEEARPLLSRMGSVLHHVGGTGQGAILKLAVNGLFGVQVAAYSEMLGMLTRQGLHEETVTDILQGLAITSPVMKAMSGLIAKRVFAPMFPISLVHKDMGYAVKAGDEAETAMPLTTAARETFADAVEQRFGDDNIVGIAQMYLKS